MTEVRGVRLDDLYRDHSNRVWEVIGLITHPVAVVRNIATGETEHHVIGCLNWKNKWREGPMRPTQERASDSAQGEKP